MKLQKRTIFYLFLLIIASIIFLWPLFRQGFIATDDGDWMIIRLSAFYQSLREGQFPVRLLGRLNYSYGYPVANFLYPGFLYIGSFLHVFDVPFVTVVKIILSGSVLVSVLCVYAWLLRFSRPSISFAASLTFLLSPYLAFDLFRRGSVGELLAIAAIAVTLYSIESRKKHLTTCSLALLILAHNSVAFLSFPFLLAYAFIRLRWYIIPSTVLAAGMSAFFWIPALTERSLVQFQLIQVANPFEYFSVNSQWILITFTHALAAIILLFQWKTLSVFQKASVLIFFIVIGITSPFSGLLWNIDSFSQLFQFPYRFLSIGLFMGTLLVVIVLSRLSRLLKYIAAIAGICILIPGLLYRYSQIVWTNQPETFYSTNEATTTVADEYLPRWVKEPPKERTSQEIEFFSGKGTIDIKELTTHKVVAYITTEEESIIQINSIYYPGWGVLVNGVPAEIQYDNPRGVIRFAVKKGSFHVISEFRETVQRFITNIISVVSFGIFIISIFVPETTKQKVYQAFVALMKEQPDEQKKKRKKSI